MTLSEFAFWRLFPEWLLVWVVIGLLAAVFSGLGWLRGVLYGVVLACGSTVAAAAAPAYWVWIQGVGWDPSLGSEEGRVFGQLAIALYVAGWIVLINAAYGAAVVGMRALGWWVRRARVSSAGRLAHTSHGGSEVPPVS